MTQREAGSWSPYLAGALTGLLIVLSAYFTGNFFGASSSFVRAAVIIEQFFSPEHVARSSYLARYLPRIDWQWLFLTGVCLGAFGSALLSGDLAGRGIPGMWESRFGPNMARRAAAAFAGGFVILVGARIAGG